jgi:fructokinase
MLLGGIEGGGTKFRCAVSTEPGRIAIEAAIPTTTPEETLSRVTQFFRVTTGGRRLGALGIASFGPLDLRTDSQTYGYITATPKPHWKDVDLVGRIAEDLDTDAIAFDTDVNAAAIAEYRWGAGRGVGTLAYITVGTGIGCGILLDGRPLHGLVHPEFGHIRIPQDYEADTFPGSCPVHGNCLEGLASGRAVAARTASLPEQLPPDHPVWSLAAHYLALGLANLICIASPERIIVGGGISQGLSWTALHAGVRSMLGAYLRSPQLNEAINQYIVPPMFGQDAGLLGALAMAEAAVTHEASVTK